MKLINSSFIGDGWVLSESHIDTGNADAAVYMSHSNDIEIDNCIFTGSGSNLPGLRGTFYGVESLNSGDVVVDSCDFSETGVAVYSWGDSWNITNNIINTNTIYSIAFILNMYLAPRKYNRPPEWYKYTILGVTFSI